MKFYLYIFYRFKNNYRYKNSSDSWLHAFMLFGALLLIHILTLIFFVQSYLKMDFINSIRIDNGIKDRFILFPLLIAPIYLWLFYYYKKNSQSIMNTIKDFKYETIKSRKKHDIVMKVYLLVSVILFLTSIISPIFSK